MQSTRIICAPDGDSVSGFHRINLSRTGNRQRYGNPLPNFVWVKHVYLCYFSTRMLKAPGSCTAHNWWLVTIWYDAGSCPDDSSSQHCPFTVIMSSKCTPMITLEKTIFPTSLRRRKVKADKTAAGWEYINDLFKTKFPSKCKSVRSLLGTETCDDFTFCLYIWKRCPRKGLQWCILKCKKRLVAGKIL